MAVDLTDVEWRSGLRLPVDYKYFISRYRGHDLYVGNQLIRIWAAENIIPFNERFGIFDRLPQTIAIGDNGYGEWIGFEELADYRVRVVLSPFMDLNNKYNIEIAPSFTQFLSALDESEEGHIPYE